MYALLLSAGFGTRLRPLTDTVAKPALRFLNIPMAGFALHHAEGLGLERLVVNLHHLPETVIRAFSELTLNTPYELIYSHEEPDILDSGGGIGQARAHLEGRGSFLVANADALMLFAHDEGLSRLWRAHQSTGALATILTCPMDGVGTRFGGVLVDDSGQVRGFSKKPPTPPLKARHFTGFMILSDRIFEHLPEGPSNIFYDVLTQAIAHGERVMTYHEDGALWFETGDSESFLASTEACLRELTAARESPPAANLRAILRRFRPRWSLAAGVSNPQAILSTGGLVSLGAPLLVDEGADLGADFQVQGFAVIGSRAVITTGCHLKECVIGPHVRLAPGTLLNRQIRI